MMNDKHILTSMLHTVQMGQSGIRCVMNKAISPALKQELSEQLRKYDDMEKQTLSLAQDLQLTLTNLNPAVETMSSVMSKLQLIGGETDSKIAGMLIQGNTRGSILGTKNLRKASHADSRVSALAKQLLQQEESNIRHSRQYL